MTHFSRRSFLAGAASLPALIGPAQALQPAARAGRELHSSLDPWIEIRADHLRHNVTEVSRRVGSRPILAVIKNNGYGLGVANVAKVLEPLSAIHGFAVVKLHEAMTLRDAGIRKPVLLMGPYDGQNLEDAVMADVMPMVYTPDGAALERIAAGRQRAVPIHVCVDTGMGRVGVPYTEAAALIRDLAGRSGVEIQGVMMTFTEDEAFDREQLKRFTALCDRLAAEGIRFGRRHAASSYTLFQHPDVVLDMVRPGMVLYGVYPEPAFRTAGVLDLRPAVSLKAQVAYVKQLRRGESAGYDRAYMATEDVWVATLPVGHGDGLPRVAASGGRVRIGDGLYPIVASVSASHCILELGRETQVTRGDEAVIFDWQEGSRPEDLAAACGGSVYDLTMHLNPLLPRRVIES